MDQYNARQRNLERLMEIYVEYYKDVTPFETLQPEPPSEQTIPLPTPRTKRTTPDQTTEGMSSSGRDQVTRETTPDGRCPKQGQTEEKLLMAPRVTRPLTSTKIDDTTPMITATISSSHFVRATNKVMEAGAPINQGRIL